MDKLLVPDTEIRLIVDNSSNDSIIENIKFEPEKIPININQIYLDGNIYTSTTDSIHDVQFLIDGKIKSSMEEMNINLTEIEISSSIPGLNFSGQGIDGILSSKKVDLNIDRGNIDDFEVSFTAKSVFSVKSIEFMKTQNFLQIMAFYRIPRFMWKC